MQNKLIKIKNIKKYYPNKEKTIKALDDVSLDLYAGEILGLLGVNGAGKTTLSSILATLHPPTAGDILFKDTSIYDNINAYRQKIGLCPQYTNLINELTVRQNLVFAGRYFGLSKETIEQRINELVKKYELINYLDSKPGILSGGYKQRVSLVRALIHQPKLVIFDEPTVGLDPHIRRHLWDSMKQLKQEGVTVILTTHYIEEAEMLSDRICILDKGVIRLIDTPAKLKSEYQKSRLEDVFLQLTQEESQ